MKYYVEDQVDAESIRFLHLASGIIKSLPDDLEDELIESSILGEDESLSCHIVAVVVTELLKIDMREGHFMNWEHSWCVTPTGNVIDVYPVGILADSCLLVDGSIARHLYKSGSNRFSASESTVNAVTYILTNYFKNNLVS